MTSDRIKHIITRLDDQLPGWDAQKLMSPIKTNQYRKPEPDARKAGVNILLYPSENRELELFFIRRQANNPNDKHGGQISFPGGQMESMDKDLKETALRETYEEIGVQPSAMTLLGQLTPLYVYVSNFLVQPIVSYIDYKPELKLQPSEVDYVISARLSYLLTHDAIAHTDFQVRDILMKNMPHYKLQNHILWGATAMITAEFIQLVKSI